MAIRWRTIRPRPVALPRQPHEILGVEQNAGREAVRKAYLRLAKIYHPDKSDPFLRRHNEEMMREVNAAYHAMRGGDEGQGNGND